MAWEQRARGGWYYKRSRRKDGRIVREYFGCGETAQLIAALDEQARQERAAERTARQDERSRPLALEAALTAFGTPLDEVLCLTLEAAGYHRHRGQWRKQRGRAHETRGDAAGDAG
jgi:hypothetical protein